MSGDESAAASGQRCDIWLYRARLFRSRALAAAFVTSGAVRVERAGGNKDGGVQRLTRPAAVLRPGDTLVFMRGRALVRITVEALAARRGPPAEARALYSSAAAAH